MGGGASALSDDFTGPDGSFPNSSIWSLWTSNPESTVSLRNNILELLGYQNSPSGGINGKSTVYTKQDFVLGGNDGIDVQVKIDGYEHGGPNFGARLRIGPSDILSFPTGYDYSPGVPPGAEDDNSVVFIRQINWGSDINGFYINNNRICYPTVSEPFIARIIAVPGGNATLYINGAKQCEGEWITPESSFKVWLAARSGGGPGEWGKFKFDNFSANVTSFLSNSGGGTWQHSRNLIINNPGAALTDYQVLVNLTGANFPTSAKADGADVRFTNSVGTELAYWIEDWNSSTQKAKVWVNVTSIPAGTSAIRMWWGNPSATSSSNGDSTFVFFDDFESGNLNKWDGADEGASVVSDNGNYVLKLYAKDSNWYNVQKNIIPADIRLDLKYKIIQDGTYDGARFGSSLRDTNNGWSSGAWAGYSDLLMDWHFLDDGTPERLLGDGSSTLDDQPVPYSIHGVWYNWGSSAVGLSSVQLKGYGKDDEVIVSAIDIDNPLPAGRLKLWIWDNEATDYVDDVRVHKFASPEPTVLAGPVAEYHFDGDASDSSGNGNDGTINGGASFVDGVSGQAMSFDGVDDYVKINKNDSWQGQDLTIELWIKPNTQSQLAAIIGCHGEGTPAIRGWIIQTYPTINGTVFGYGNGIAWLGPDGFNLIANVWQHLSVTKSGNSIKIYLNGTVLESYTTTDAAILYGTGSERPDLYIGNWFGHTYWDRSLNGLIDEVRIYNHALSADEIKAEYDKLAPPTDTVAPAAPSPDDGVSGWGKVNTPAFTWTAPSDTSEIAGYYYKVDSGSESWITTTTVTLPAQSDGTHTFYVKAKDNAGNIGTFGSHSFSIDTTPPRISITSPTGGQIFTTSIITVSGAASDTVGLGKLEVKVETGSWQLASGTTSWSASVTLASGSNTIYARATDISGNSNETSVMVTSSQTDTTPSASITDLHNISYAQTYINWTWTDPAVPDFSRVMIYLDGSFRTNVTKGGQYYNATGLTAGSTHTIATRTVDTLGNINLTWVNHTAITHSSGELRGDVNRNGIRDTGDATTILRYIVEFSIPQEYLPILPIGDVNCNGIIDTGDATLVLRDVVGLPISNCWEW